MDVHLKSAGSGCAAAFLCLALFANAAAQDRYVRIARQHDRPAAYHEALVLPDADASQAVVTFRIPNSLLVFVQQDDRFTSSPEVLVELFTNGSKIDERIWRGNHAASSFEETQDPTTDLVGHVTFDLKPGSYAYELSLNDGAAGAPGTGRRRAFDVPDPYVEVIGRPFFARIDTGAAGRIRTTPANLGGNAPFGEETPTVLPMGSVESGDRMVFRLYRIDRERLRQQSARGGRYDLGHGDRLIADGGVALDRSIPVGDVTSDCVCWMTGGDSARLVLLDLAVDTLENGAYLLDFELSRGGARYTRRATFETLWKDMPLSLYDPEVAIRNLEFIESRELVKSMLRGSRDELIDRFRAYWRDRDPTPNTVFNELMAEYYRRIDVAARRFQTGTTPYPDGLRTDPARIFIVHGPPEDISNSFPSSGGVEQVWTYPDGRQFVFRAASSLDRLELEAEPPARTSGE